MAGKRKIPIWIWLWLVAGSVVTLPSYGLYLIFKSDSTLENKMQGKTFIIQGLGIALFWTILLWLISRY